MKVLNFSLHLTLKLDLLVPFLNVRFNNAANILTETRGNYKQELGMKTTVLRVAASFNIK